MKKYSTIICSMVLALRCANAGDLTTPSNAMLRAASALQQFLSEAKETNTLAHVRECRLETQGTRLVVTTTHETIFVTTGETYRRSGYHMEPHPEFRYLTWNTQAPGVQLSVYQQRPTYVHIEKSPVVLPRQPQPPEEKDAVVAALLRAFRRNGIELTEANEEAPNNASQPTK
ncbi:MAG: hypothetical protein K8T26_12880 [Lentisphaerae bacterium]|nr:hypothetical protein [Lentisphaerota bacterium]